MSRETRTIKRFPNETGTITQGNGTPAQVIFSLSVTQDFVDGIPTLKSGFGTIHFKDRSRVSEFFMSRANTALKSDNVQTVILLKTMDSFLTNGPVLYAGAPAD
jgi:hypothetical protein